jgi:hypothetical protein
MNTATPFPAFPDIDREWEAHKQRLMALTATQRVAAMRAGELSYRELAHWTAVRPDEVPCVCTGQGGRGEFEWIAALEPELAEPDDGLRAVPRPTSVSAPSAPFVAGDSAAGISNPEAGIDVRT